MPFQLINSSPDVMLGKPVIAGTRITVASILERLATGETEAQILDAHPRMTPQHIRECLAYAASLLGSEVIYDALPKAA